jgi:hypothetical protein
MEYSVFLEEKGAMEDPGSVKEGAAKSKNPSSTSKNWGNIYRTNNKSRYSFSCMAKKIISKLNKIN